jgi:hypothetical protein
MSPRALLVAQESHRIAHVWAVETYGPCESYGEPRRYRRNPHGYAQGLEGVRDHPNPALNQPQATPNPALSNPRPTLSSPSPAPREPIKANTNQKAQIQPS